jgi:hypothetical protein
MTRLRPLLAVTCMVLFGFATYLSLGYSRSTVVHHPVAAPLPTAKPAFTLPGTLFMAEAGGLIQLHGLAFTQVSAAGGGWSQPALSPDGGHLVAVRRSGNVSDLYQLGLDGSVQKQLTHNAASIVEVNQWAFYPRYSADGSQLLFSTDRPKVYDYRVDLAVWAMPAGGGAEHQWTDPNSYTGGDVQAVPLASGGILYTKYSISDAGDSVSQIFLVPRLRGPETALTAPADLCQQPAVSPDGTRLAMICTSAARVAQLVVAPFDGNQIGARQVVVDGTLAAAPSWAPDGSGLAYLAPGSGDPGGGFQLWWAPLAGAPRQLTNGADLDALSPAAWLK